MWVVHIFFMMCVCVNIQRIQPNSSHISAPKNGKKVNQEWKRREQNQTKTIQKQTYIAHLRLWIFRHSKTIFFVVWFVLEFVQLFFHYLFFLHNIELKLNIFYSFQYKFYSWIHWNSARKQGAKEKITTILFAFVEPLFAILLCTFAIYLFELWDNYQTNKKKEVGGNNKNYENKSIKKIK